MKATLIACPSLISLKKAERTVIRCEQGQLWISVPGEDIVLRRGESWQINSPLTVLIEGAQDARFSLQTPRSVWHLHWPGAWRWPAFRSSWRVRSSPIKRIQART
ncbi:DUF2917 domain-containing protein [Silvimonas iriomotensis]|uniref:DUF2917 domain-containing protein n=1 Tax=Silvimonas iriomotensis TaxID=449662 RepID=A0ABQ2P694_9NEIS|nr:DUF2917 domain-containing protein [Silvimonas iriomotensis]GGP18994.1 hypothetical protein GCM10010970_08410 [Silvimonas iriomotensis]